MNENLWQSQQEATSQMKTIAASVPEFIHKKSSNQRFAAMCFENLNDEF